MKLTLYYKQIYLKTTSLVLITRVITMQGKIMLFFMLFSFVVLIPALLESIISLHSSQLRMIEVLIYKYARFMQIISTHIFN